MLIDCSYFVSGQRQIQNATLGTPSPLNKNAEEVNRIILSYISEFQESFLNNILGIKNGYCVNRYLLEIDSNAETERIEVYDKVCEKLKESFADYVFFHILRYSGQHATITGLVKLKGANEYLSPITRQVLIWNTMVERNRRFVEWVGSCDCGLPDISVSSNMTTRINTFNL